MDPRLIVKSKQYGEYIVRHWYDPKLLVWRYTIAKGNRKANHLCFSSQEYVDAKVNSILWEKKYFKN